jgi:16S rRNA (cytidine1402-2'-O)-methyltransferase
MRLMDTLEDLLDLCGDRRIVIAREMTKIFEEIIRGKISEVISQLRDRKVKGEITIMLEGYRDDKKKRTEESLPDDDFPG